MNDDLSKFLFAYLQGHITLSDIHDWMAVNVWNLTGDAQELADELGVELAYIDDGYSNEAHFQSRVLEILQRLGVIDRTYQDETSEPITSTENVTVRRDMRPPPFRILSLERISTGAPEPVANQI